MSQYSTNPGNPVEALQERCQSRGVAPEYRTIQVQVQVGDMVAMGEIMIKLLGKFPIP